MKEKKRILTSDLLKTIITVSTLDPAEAKLALKLLAKIKEKKAEKECDKSSNLNIFKFLIGLTGLTQKWVKLINPYYSCYHGSN